MSSTSEVSNNVGVVRSNGNSVEVTLRFQDAHEN